MKLIKLPCIWLIRDDVKGFQHRGKFQRGEAYQISNVIRLPKIMKCDKADVVVREWDTLEPAGADENSIFGSFGFL